MNSLQQQLEYTLLKPDCPSWWISKMQSDTYKNDMQYNYVLELEKCQRNVWKASDCFWTILHESNISFLSGINFSPHQVP